ncbi:MAG: Omp28-related outer membrane protein [candidate division WOR-3 bacterium]|nr:Omp28-related outer membrane protein [candidate division WOR-3 bacterium]
MGIEWHIVNGSPLYSPEGWAKWWQYPPPYEGGYATPWCWIDGKSRGYQPNLWAGYVADELLVPTEVSLALSGEYNRSARTGTLTAVIHNAATSSLDAALLVAITEDSIYYVGSNGDTWQNHVLRDYVPDQNGTTISIPSGAYDTVTINYALDSTWVEHFTKVVAYVQSSSTQPDSSRPCYQAQAAPVLSFVGTAEPRIPESFYDNATVAVGPNPCRANAQFRFTGRAGRGYRLDIYSRDGRLVRELAGTINPGMNTLAWDRTDVRGRKVAGGVYGFRLVSTGTSAPGKLVLTD